MTTSINMPLFVEETTPPADSPSPEELAPLMTVELAEVSLFNWGSFHGMHTAPIDDTGTLITGDNGAGKSTLVDGIIALLISAGKAAFNIAAAQGNTSDRNLVSYIRGSYGSDEDGDKTKPKSKREAGVISGLRALFRWSDGSFTTLCGVFWTTGTSHSLADFKRLHIVAKRDLSLQELLEVFGDANARKLKNHLTADPAISCVTDKFSDYQDHYRQVFRMDNKNGPALLARALGLKKVDDLTGMIRNLVLEPSGIRDKARAAVEEFKDLVAIHKQLTDARDQCQILKPLPGHRDTMMTAEIADISLSQEKRFLPAYLAQQALSVGQQILNDIHEKLATISRKLSKCEQDEQDGQELQEQRHGEYLELGGHQIETIKKDLKRAKERLEFVTKQSSKYQTACRELGLATTLKEEAFLGHLAEAEATLAALEQQTEQRQDQFAKAKGQLSARQDAHAELTDTITAIKARPDSNIDDRQQDLRDKISAELEIPVDQLVFVGELLDVKPEERAWQGAIERALGGRRSTLLVPAKVTKMVIRWLNTRHTRLHVRLQEVGLTPKGQPIFMADGFLRKLNWKEHPYRDWLKHHLVRADLHCVGGTDQLNETPFSMTREGLVHMNAGRYEKKDQQKVDDRRFWCLGFSNKTRLAVLIEDERALAAEIEQLLADVTTARQALNKVQDDVKLWEHIGQFQWEDIDVPRWHSKVVATEERLRELEDPSHDLAKAHEAWLEAKRQLAAIVQRKDKLLQERGATDKDRQATESRLERLSQQADLEVPEATAARLQERCAESVDFYYDSLKARLDRDLEAELREVRATMEAATHKALQIMASFRGKDKWLPITVDWPEGIEGLTDFIDHLKGLEDEGLPQLVEAFQERLNKNATQSIARIKNDLDMERDHIVRRIERINSALKRTDFRPGTHLVLDTKRLNYAHVREFNQKLVTATGMITSDDHDLRYKHLKEVIDILSEASATSTYSNLRSLRLLDPRHQMAFNAKEIDNVTGKVREVLASSDNKSGGEKESFAGAILAASLTYVLTPDDEDQPVFRTVFLDEALSNTDEAASRRVLRIFKELGLKVNMITPYKNLNLAREAAGSLLIVERDADHHESRLSHLTWEELDRQMEERAKQLQEEAGITLDPTPAAGRDEDSDGALHVP